MRESQGNNDGDGDGDGFVIIDDDKCDGNDVGVGDGTVSSMQWPVAESVKKV